MANYQTLQSYTPAITQRKDLTLVEETNAQSLLIVCLLLLQMPITADSTANIPAEEQVQKTVFVKTGAYKEVLSIRATQTQQWLAMNSVPTKVQSV